MSISVDTIVNVSTSLISGGLNAPNINSVALFTTESPNFLEQYKIYNNSRSVELDFGTNSVTKKMADAFFAQSNNVLTGFGRLVIIPLQGSVSAKPETFQTTSLATNLANLILVNNGDLKVVSNGITYNLTKLDFTKATSVEDIVAILQAKLKNIIITNNTNQITFSSKIVGTNSSIALGSVTSGTGTDLSGANYFDISNGTTTAGTDALGETILEAIARTQLLVQYKMIVTNLEMEDSVITAIATSVQSLKYIFLHHFVDLNYFELNELPNLIRQANQTYTRCLAYTIDFESANLMKCAYASIYASVNFNGNLTDNTMNLKTLVNILPDSNIDNTLIEKAKVVGLDVYVGLSEQNVGATIVSGGNVWSDVVRDVEALSLTVQYNSVNALINTNTKIPQTEAGMQIIRDAILSACNQFVTNGVIAAGTWNGQCPFGNQNDFKRSIQDVGYYIYQDPIATQSQSQRDQRIAPQIYIAIKLSGAVHLATIGILVQQ